ncbi:hypothetical protein B6A09_2075 [Saccharomyces cerevisiae synthetic construct]|uniref:Putative uncharacterized protein YBR277C n=2 Tax=Saccharomyces cerevisiae TaxID=4932 RepID=YB9U_YEAST|nr:RecName: Full=Putative uncharacterized protein YBR277C [Saccharomyces cerevisiae S288C]ARB02090.1 hypothetical protein B6A09_2075 [Saccharomyces cerevisiae synthetic construct]CAA53640.1 unnamed protein product [Saccharomyces cerevisiae]CBK39354.1 EC1118_1B15_4610p [Saccharomyces cerevisiae EC1118]WNV72183.1 hypothetical protein O6U65_0430 [Saccharomyces cerevisiae synthetic construct]CAA85241.1 unnamed protein product [Saccharomyces cerevisiae]
MFSSLFLSSALFFFSCLMASSRNLKLSLFSTHSSIEFRLNRRLVFPFEFSCAKTSDSSTRFCTNNSAANAVADIATLDVITYSGSHLAIFFTLDIGKTGAFSLTKLDIFFATRLTLACFYLLGQAVVKAINFA